MIDAIRQAAHAITSWWQSRPTQRRMAKLKARRDDIMARIESERRNHRRVSHLYAQLKAVTTELLRLEMRRVA